MAVASESTSKLKTASITEYAQTLWSQRCHKMPPVTHLWQWALTMSFKLTPIVNRLEGKRNSWVSLTSTSSSSLLILPWFNGQLLETIRATLTSASWLQVGRIQMQLCASVLCRMCVFRIRGLRIFWLWAVLRTLWPIIKGPWGRWGVDNRSLSAGPWAPHPVPVLANLAGTLLA